MYRIIGADQKEYGPVSADDLRKWIAEGRANAQTRAWTTGMAEWRPLGSLPEFAALFPAQAYVPPTPYVPSSRTNGMAVTGFLFSLLGIPCCMTILFPVLGLIFSMVALGQTSRNGAENGRGLAVAGLVISIVTLLFAIFCWIVGSFAGVNVQNSHTYQL
ncbi:MAG TPA: GYF domain-containing protein [Verrucomicrobiae bacterium]|nr:GYF domain-containing protein [Verrucomicrobiae bacterium]